MKIMPMSHREKQVEFFGKRGTTPEDASVEKDVAFQLMIQHKTIHQ